MAFLGQQPKCKSPDFPPRHFQLVLAALPQATLPKGAQIPGNSEGAAWWLGP